MINSLLEPTSNWKETIQALHWERGRLARREREARASCRIMRILYKDRSRLTALLRASRPRSQWRAWI